MKTLKKSICLFLCLVMVFSLLPLETLAADLNDDSDAVFAVPADNGEKTAEASDAAEVSSEDAAEGAEDAEPAAQETPAESASEDAEPVDPGKVESADSETAAAEAAVEDAESADPADPESAEPVDETEAEPALPADASESDGWVYRIEEDHAVVLGYLDYRAEELEIPDALGGYPVTAIAEKAFADNSGLKRMYIHGNVTSIAADAFGALAVRLRGYSGTEVLRYADAHGYSFKNLSTTDYMELLPEVIDYTYALEGRYEILDGNTIRFAEAEGKLLAEGSIFYLPEINADGLLGVSCVVETIRTDDTGYVVTVSKADPYSVYVWIDVSDDNMQPVWEDAVWAEGVSVAEEKWWDPEIGANPALEGHIGLNFDKDLGHGFKFKGNLGVNVKAEAAVRYNFIDKDFKELKLSVKPTFQGEAGISLGGSTKGNEKEYKTREEFKRDCYEKKILIGRVPIVSAWALLTVNANVYLKVSFTGEIKLTFEVGGEFGGQLNRVTGEFEKFGNYIPPNLTLDVKATFDFGPALGVSLSVIGLGDVVSADIFGGLEITAKWSTKHAECIDISVFFKVNLTIELTLSIKGSSRFEHGRKWDFDLFSFKVADWHWEHGKLVPSCTYEGLFLVKFYTGTSETQEDVKVEGGNTIAEPTIKMSGNKILGWYQDENYTQLWNFSTDKVTKDITLYARWENEPKTVTFKYNATDESQKELGYDSHALVVPGSTISSPEQPKRMDYKFTGWYKTKAEAKKHGDTGKWDFSNDVMPNQNLTLYAGWEYSEGYNPFTTSSSGSGYDYSEDGWMSFGGHEYLHIADYVTFQEAQAVADSYGAYLVTLTSEEEANAVYQYCEYDCAQDALWLGINSTTGWTHWLTGEKVTMSNWENGTVPRSGGNQYNGAFDRTGDHTWRGIDNNSTRHYIIERGDYVADSGFTTTVNEIEYERNETDMTTSVTGFNSSSEEVDLNSSWLGTPVTSIGDEAFRNNTELQTITLPGTLKTIGNYAFAGCSNLKEIVLPDTVVSIGAHAFDGCTSLTKVVLSGSMTAVPDSAFNGCTSLKSINLDKITSIGTYAFQSCRSLVSVDFSSKLTQVGQYAFSGCTKLTTGTLPNSVSSVGNYVFSGCTSLTRVTIPTSISTIPNGMYNNCTGLKTIIVPDSVKTIRSNAFNKVTGTFYGKPNSAIADWCDTNSKTFVSTENRHSVSFQNGNGGNEIGNIGAVKDGETLDMTFAYVGERITEPTVSADGYILEGWYTEPDFQNRWDFALNTMPDSELTLYAKWIEGESAYTYTISDGKATITAYLGSSETVELPGSLGGAVVTSIAENAFASNSTIREVILPASVTEIESGVFAGCDNLYQVNTKNNPNFKTQDGALYDAALTTLICVPAAQTLVRFTVPDGVTTIAGEALVDHETLSAVEVPESVSEIGANALPASVFLTVYGPVEDCAIKAYANANGLKYNIYEITFYDGDEVVYSANAQAGSKLSDFYTPTEDFRSFAAWCKDAELTNVWDAENDTMPAGNLSLYLKWQSDFRWETNGNSLTITGYTGDLSRVILPESIGGKSVTAIAAGAFTDTETALVSVTIPTSVTSIAAGAFPAGLTLIGDAGSTAETYAAENDLTFERRAYQVTFNTDGGAELDPITAIPGETLTLPEPIRSNYHFMGWYTTDTSILWSEDDVMPSADLELTAYWKVINSNVTNKFKYEVLEDGTACITAYQGDKQVLEIPEEINGFTVAQIGDFALSGTTNLLVVFIPESVTSIGRYAFQDSSVRTISGGENVVSLGEGCFSGAASLQSLYLPAGVTEIPAYCYSGCTALISASIPDGVNTIGQGAFSNCRFLNTIEIPESVTEIGAYAFSGCDSLRSVSLPATLQPVREDTFDSRTEIGYRATRGVRLLSLKQTTKNAVHLVWNEVEGESQYYVYRKQGSQGDYSLIKSVTGTETDNYNLTPGLTYYFKVKAKTSSAESQEVAISINSFTTPKISSLVQTSATTAQMSWGSVNGASSYEIYRAYDEDGPFTLLKTVEGTTTENSGLIGGMQYYYTIRAVGMVDGEQEYSAFSDVYAFRMPSRYLAAPEDVVVRESAKGTILINWLPVEGADGYIIYRQKGSGQFAQVKTTSETQAYNYNLTVGETYGYKVCAYYYDGSDLKQSDSSAVVPVVINELATPAIKSISQSAAGTALVSWTSISAANGYELWRGRSADGPYYLMKSVDGIAASNYNLTVGVTYFYKVRAFTDDNAGNREYGAFSEPASVEIGEVAKTRIKNVFQQTGNAARIEWAAVTGATSYEVWRSVNDNAHFELLRDTSGTAIQDKNLTDGQTYYYKIRAYKAGENAIYGAESDVMSVTVIGTPVIQVLEQSTESSALLMWSKVYSADGYEVLVSNTSGGNYTVEQDVQATQTTIYNLNQGSTYYYKVRAYRMDSNGNKSYGINSGYKGTTILGVPEITSIKQNGANGVLLTWSTVPNAESYELWRSTTEGGGYTKIKSVTETNTGSYSLSGDTKYFYKVNACVKLNGVTQHGAKSEAMGISILSTPQITSVDQIGTNSCKISWDAVKFATAYRIYRSESPNGTFSLIKTVSDVGTENYNLKVDHAYYYKIKALMDENGDTHESATSAALGVYITSLDKPVVTRVEHLDSNSLQVQWSSVEGADGYEVWCIRAGYDDEEGYEGEDYYDEEDEEPEPTATPVADSPYLPGASYVLVDTTELNSARISGISGTNCQIRVRAYKEVDSLVGKGKLSDTADVRYVGIPTVNFIDQLSTSSIKLKWTSASNAASYNVYRRSGNGAFWLIATTTEMEYTDTGLTPDTNYSYRIMAIADDGFEHVGAMSNLRGYYLSSLEAPVITQVDSKTLKFDPVEGADGYILYRTLLASPQQNNWDEGEDYYEGEGYDDEYMDGIYTHDTTVSISIPEGYIYLYKVRAYQMINYEEDGGDEVYSACSEVKTANLAQPDNAIAYQTDSTHAALGWDETRGIDGYELWRSDDGGANYQLIEGSVDGTDPTALENGQTYYYKVREYVDSVNRIYSPYSAASSIQITDIGEIGPYPESEHDYYNGMNQTWTYTISGAEALYLKFSDASCTESGCDNIYVMDGNGTTLNTLTGDSFHGLQIVVPGDTVKLRMTTDGSVTRYGFSFDYIRPASNSIFTQSEGNEIWTLKDGVLTIGSTNGVITNPYRYPQFVRKIVIADGVKRILANAIGSYSNVLEIELPDSLKFIGENAFSSIGNLSLVHYAGTESAWNDMTIQDGNDLLIEAYQRALSYSQREVVDLTLDQWTAGEFNTEESEAEQLYCAYFRFVPETTGQYAFVSEGSSDLSCNLYDSGWNYIGSENSYGDTGFLLRGTLEAGQTYYFRVVDSPESGVAFRGVIRSMIPVELEADVPVQATVMSSCDELYFNFTPQESAYYAWSISSEEGFNWSETSLNCYKTGNDAYYIGGNTFNYEDDFPVDYLTTGYYFEAGETYQMVVRSNGTRNLTICVSNPEPVALTIGETYTMNFSAAQPMNCYTFTPEVSGSYGFAFRSAENVRWILYDSEWNTLNEYSTSLYGEAETVRFSLDAGETYYMAAAGYDEVPTGGVTFAFRSFYGTPIEVGDTVTEYLLNSGDNAVYRFTPDISEIYTLQVTKSSSAFADIYVEDMYSHECWQTSTGDENANASLTLAMTEGRNYYIRISADPYGDVIFTLNPLSATDLINGQTVAGTILEDAGQSYFRVNVEQEGSYTFSTSDEEVYVELIDSGMNIISSARSDYYENEEGDGYYNLSMRTMLREGTYYLRAWNEAEYGDQVHFRMDMAPVIELLSGQSLLQSAAGTNEYYLLVNSDMTGRYCLTASADVPLTLSLCDSGWNEYTSKSGQPAKLDWGTTENGSYNLLLRVDDSLDETSQISLQLSSTVVEPITAGTQKDADITEKGMVCYYAFTPEATGVYAFYADGNLDTYGYLYNTSWEEMYANDDYGDSSNFRIVSVMAAGQTYFLGAKIFSSSKTGTFQVQVDQLSCSEIAADESKSVLLAGEGAVEFLKVTADQSATYKIATEATNDVKLSAYRDDGTLLSSSTGTNPFVSWSANQGETVYVRIQYTEEYLTGSVTATLTKQVMPTLTLNQSSVAEINESGERVRFLVQISEAQYYYFYSDAGEDTYGYLYDENMNQLASDDDSGWDSNFRIYRYLTPGTYYVEARYYSSDNTGEFDVWMSLNFDDPYEDDGGDDGYDDGDEGDYDGEDE